MNLKIVDHRLPMVVREFAFLHFMARPRHERGFSENRPGRVPRAPAISCRFLTLDIDPNAPSRSSVTQPIDVESGSDRRRASLLHRQIDLVQRQ